MYVPRIRDIDTALRIYYSYTELDTELLRTLFEGLSSSTLYKLRRRCKEVMADRGVKCFGRSSVNTKIAFEVFGLDPADLEERKRKLQKLGLGNGGTP